MRRGLTPQQRSYDPQHVKHRKLQDGSRTVRIQALTGVAASSAPESTSSTSHPARLHLRGQTLPDAEAGHVRTHKNLKFGNWR